MDNHPGLSGSGFTVLSWKLEETSPGKGALRRFRPLIARARHLLDAYLKEERRTLTEGGSHACAVCEYYRGDVCCDRRQA